MLASLYSMNFDFFKRTLSSNCSPYRTSSLGSLVREFRYNSYMIFLILNSFYTLLERRKLRSPARKIVSLNLNRLLLYVSESKYLWT